MDGEGSTVYDPAAGPGRVFGFVPASGPPNGNMLRSALSSDFSFSPYLTADTARIPNFKWMRRRSRETRRSYKRQFSSEDGPLRKRRATEEQVVKDMGSLTLTEAEQQKKKNAFERWKELETRLATEGSDSDNDLESDRDVRLVLSEEVRNLTKTASHLLPMKPVDNSLAVVLWSPPARPLPPLSDPTRPPAGSVLSPHLQAPPSPTSVTLGPTQLQPPASGSCLDDEVMDLDL